MKQRLFAIEIINDFEIRLSFDTKISFNDLDEWRERLGGKDIEVIVKKEADGK
jgi:hypothetical protein